MRKTIFHLNSWRNLKSFKPLDNPIFFETSWIHYVLVEQTKRSTWTWNFLSSVGLDMEMPSLPWRDDKLNLRYGIPSLGSRKKSIEVGNFVQPVCFTLHYLQPFKIFLRSNLPIHYFHFITFIRPKNAKNSS